jgi:hypothetical protein
MYKRETHKMATAYKGSVENVASPGQGVPMADPALVIVGHENAFAGDGLDIVSNVGIAVGINANGYLAPCDGADIKPFGIVANPLLGTARIVGSSYLGGAETTHQVTPTVYQENVLFEVGMAHDATGVVALTGIFDIKVGDCLRPITTAEVAAAVADGSLPQVLDTVEKTKAFYAGTLVKWIAATDAADQICGRALSIEAPGVYEVDAYQTYTYGYDIQGEATLGHHRGVWNVIGGEAQDAKFTKKIINFKVSL